MTEYSVREQRGWYVYDWANSAFVTTGVALFLGPYLTALAKAAADANGFVHPLGIRVDARSYWSYLVSLSVILQVLVLPIVGAVADYGHRKKQYLAVTAYGGAAAATAMFWLQESEYLLGGALFILLLYLNAARIGITETMAVRISLGSAGVWWAVFTIPTLMTLRNRAPAHAIPRGQRAVGAVLGQLRHTVADIRRYPQTMTFLIAYLLYNDAIQAVLALASQFGNDELKIPVSSLTLAILMVQFVGFFGAIGFEWLAAVTGAKRAIMVSLVLWTATLIYLFAWVRSVTDFFIAAAMVAIVMGGSQALSRSVFAQLIPPGKEAEYFSIYEVSDKGTSWVSPLVFGLALQITHSYRQAILSLIVFFIAGLVVLARVDVKRGAADAGQYTLSPL